TAPDQIPQIDAVTGGVAHETDEREGGRLRASAPTGMPALTACKVGPVALNGLRDQVRGNRCSTPSPRRVGRVRREPDSHGYSGLSAPVLRLHAGGGQKSFVANGLCDNAR